MPVRRAFQWLVRILAAGAVVLALTAAIVCTHALIVSHRSALPSRVDTIIVLGAGTRADGSPDSVTLRRVALGARLYAAGLAGRVHLTGGHGNPDVMGLGVGMARAAAGKGVPTVAMTSESASRSTLQNALFSAAILPPDVAGRVLLVSDGYHLARASASFRWAGYDIAAVAAATPFGGGAIRFRIRRLVRETLAWWFNLARLTLFVALDATGAERSRTIPLISALPPGGDRALA